ncbi:porin [Roseovarius ramblicola]|uniref:Porin n=1 Tax=Roseovarius ramblicola TaxID=2022336 RepID=A0ABV5HZ64_9RHOB
MKKHLLSTSAIALGVAMAAPASAAEWDVSWGGFANVHVGAVSIDDDTSTSDWDGVDVYTNAEIIFSPSVTLDNGMTFGYSVQMEAMNGFSIDESYMTISSDTLGKVVLGSENSAGYALMGSVYTPHPSSMAINSRSTSAFIPVTGSTGFRQAGLSSLTEVAGNNDVQRITYFTPSFNGLTLGVSYAATDKGNASNNFGVDRDAGGDVVDIFDIGAKYSQSFNGVDIGLAARWGTGDRNATAASAATCLEGTPSSTAHVYLASDGDCSSGDITLEEGTTADAGGDPTTWAVGGTIGVSGFTFGATYAENNDDRAGDINDQKGYSFGASYDLAGPWSVGATMYHGEEETAGRDNEYKAYQVGARRSLGTGVSWDIYYVHQETQNSAGTEIEGDLFGTAVNLSF